ncbi:MAG: SdpI family protein [Erysipelotrichaceae bacterium]|nr:SdpI family protein [Erysipelotrichaceae bacterium]
MEKIRKNKIKIIITGLLTLVPIFVALAMWDKLPDTVPVHWNMNGEADNYWSKTGALIGMPFILLAVHVISIFVTVADPKRKNISDTAFSMVLFICPAMSIIISAIEMNYALGREVSVNRIVMLIMGVLFIVLGNYLPKSRRNYTVGIKVPWALNSDNNWNATHRFGGFVYILIGLISLILGLLPGISGDALWIYLIVLLVAATAPVIYSFIYYIKYEKEEE